MKWGREGNAKRVFGHPSNYDARRVSVFQVGLSGEITPLGHPAYSEGVPLFDTLVRLDVFYTVRKLS